MPREAGVSDESQPTNGRGLRPKTVATAAYTFGAMGVLFAAVDWGIGHALTFAALAGTVSFLAELVVVRAGLLEHHIEPQIAGVPLAALAGWTGVTAFAIRAALHLGGAFPPWLPTAVLAGLFATLADALVDERGVEAGAWEYPEHPLSRLRSGPVPWWNFVGWLVLTSVLARVADVVGVF